MGGSISMQAKSVRRRRGIALFRRIQYAPPPPHMNELMKYGVPVALGLLTLRYQLKPDALFCENPAPLWSFVAATVVYWLTVGAMTGRERYDEILRRVALAFGGVSLLSLLSMFLPHPISLLLLLMIIPVLLLLALFFAYTWIHPPILTVTNKIQAMLQQPRSPHRTQLHQTKFQPHNLPV